MDLQISRVALLLFFFMMLLRLLWRMALVAHTFHTTVHFFRTLQHMLLLQRPVSCRWLVDFRYWEKTPRHSLAPVAIRSPSPPSPTPD
jgi:hypothetical protein